MNYNNLLIPIGAFALVLGSIMLFLGCYGKIAELRTNIESKVSSAISESLMADTWGRYFRGEDDIPDILLRFEQEKIEL